MWSDPDQKNYMAVTAHWLELVQKKVTLKANLIGFLHVPGNHTGERLARVLQFIIDRVELDKKVMSFFIIEV
jgi:hypothetical protein